MLFVSYDALSKMSKDTPMLNLPEGYMAVSATVEKGGLAFDSYGLNKADKNSKLFAEMKPLDIDAVGALPRAPYGVLALQSVDKMGVGILGQLSATQKDNRIQEELDGFEKSTGFNLKEDVLPALDGTSLVALYPGNSAKPEDVQLLMSIKDGEGVGEAGKIANRIRNRMNKEAVKNGDQPKWTTRKEGSYIWWELDPTSLNATLPRGRNSSASFAKNPGYVITPTGVLLGSSKEILSRAVFAETGKFRLDQSAEFKQMQKMIAENSPSVFMMNPSKIMDAVIKAMGPALEGSSIKIEDLKGIFGTGLIPMVASGAYNGKSSNGKMFVPLDYDKLCKVIRAASEKPKRSRLSLPSEPRASRKQTNQAW